MVYTEDTVLAKEEGVQVVKMDGTRENFDPEKLRGSLRRAGAPTTTIEAIVLKIEHEIEDGMTTGEIYKRAYNILEKEERPVAARYSLRRAITEFGPSGFPFEHFVSEIFRAKGFEVQTGVMVQGKCVEHEVDMIAENDSTEISMEIKFHNNPKIKSDLKVALYVKSRFDDIFAEQSREVSGKEKQGWLLTNTKFTKNALRYAECAGLNIVSWSYPGEENLHKMIEETGLHPLTCLTGIPAREKTLLVNQGIVLCRDIKQNPNLLEEVGLKEDVISNILDEANQLCVPTVN